MERRKIKEILVVEGKNDTRRLQQFFDCDTVETGGLRLDKGALEYLGAAGKSRGVIIFTDPDSPGEYIRRQVMAICPQAKHVFIDKQKARTDKKVGVEHAGREDLEAALADAVTFDSTGLSLSWADFVDLGLTGDKGRRMTLCSRAHIGPCNAKTCFKRINALGLSRADVERMLYDGN